MPLDGELLGDPRLRGGMAYYPAVAVSGSIVTLGNVVSLSLATPAGKKYIGYGHLKGIWLWKDQPYVRVQYLAPLKADPPEGAIIALGSPEAGAMTELLVTSKVDDLRLDAIRGLVSVKGGPLAGQLFQRNVGQACPRVHCTRMVDASLKSAQPIEASMKLTPPVQPFGHHVILAVCGLPHGDEAAAAPPPDEQPAEVAAAAATGAPSAPRPAASGSAGGTAASAAVAGRPPSRVLLRMSLAGSLLQADEVVRYPGSLEALRAKLADMYGLWRPSVKVAYQRGYKHFALKSSEDLVALVEALPVDAAAAMPLRVSGAAQVTAANFACALIALANVAASAAFAYACVWRAALPAPWLYAAALPCWLVVYNAVACAACVAGEYASNRPLRTHLDAAETGASLFVLAALLGPAFVLLFHEVRLAPLGAALSKPTAQGLRQCALVGHVVHGLPLVVLNLLLHASVPWDATAVGVLVASALSLAIVLPWEILELGHVRNLALDEGV